MSKALDTKLKRLTWICRKPQDGKRTNSYKLSFDFHKHAVADEHTHTHLCINTCPTLQSIINLRNHLVWGDGSVGKSTCYVRSNKH